jgi:hypothetical protein
MRDHCCMTMTAAISTNCALHPGRSDCPDALVAYVPKFDEYGLLIHDGGTSSVTIAFCPWCGVRLPASKRDRWFDTLERMSIDPSAGSVPLAFETDEWWASNEFSCDAEAGITTRSLWRPAWYELDQSLEVGIEDDFAFCVETPAAGPVEYELVFHNPLLMSRDAVVRRARILRINHPVLGDLQRIETEGLVYVFTLSSGEQVRVEAEESPGKVEGSPGSQIANVVTWDFDVTLAVSKA